MANFELELVSVIIVELPQLKLSSSRFEGIVEIFALLQSRLVVACICALLCSHCRGFLGELCQRALYVSNK